MGFAATIIRKSSSLTARFLSGVRAAHCVSSPCLFPLLRVGSGKCNDMIRSGSRRFEGFGSFRFFSVASDSSLLGAIDAEIQCAVESEDHDQVSFPLLIFRNCTDNFMYNFMYNFIVDS